MANSISKSYHSSKYAQNLSSSFHLYHYSTCRRHCHLSPVWKYPLTISHLQPTFPYSLFSTKLSEWSFNRITPHLCSKPDFPTSLRGNRQVLTMAFKVLVVYPTLPLTLPPTIPLLSIHASLSVLKQVTLLSDWESHSLMHSEESQTQASLRTRTFCSSSSLMEARDQTPSPPCHRILAGPLHLRFLDSAEHMSMPAQPWGKKQSPTYLNKPQGWIFTVILLASAASILFSN